MFGAHGLIAACTDGYKIVECDLSTGRLGEFVTCLEVCNIHDITAPGSCTLGFEVFACITDPSLPFNSLRDMLLLPSSPLGFI